MIKKTMKRFAALATLLTTGSLWAAAPVVLWNGSFDDWSTTDNGATYTKDIDGTTYTIALNGHTFADGCLTISDSANSDRKGVTITRNNASGDTGGTVLVKYANYKYDASKTHQIPLTVKCTKTGYENILDVFAAENNQLKGDWANCYNNNNGTPYNSQVSCPMEIDGSTHVLALTYGNNSGGYAYQKKTDGSWQEVYKHIGLKGTGTYEIDGFAVGGFYQAPARSNTSANESRIADGMKVYAIAVSYSPITTVDSTDLTGFSFPEPEGSTLATLEITPEGDISASKINEKVVVAEHKNVKVTLGDGATLDLDEALTLSTKVVCTGSITLTGNLNNLAMLDLSGVQGTIGRTWIEKGLGFNFNANGGSNTSAALEDTTWFSNASGNNGSGVNMTSDGLTKITWTSKNVYTDGQNSGTFVCGYLDDGNGVDIQVTNIPFKKYAVIIYATTDTAGATLSYKTVNGKNYTAGTDGIAVEGTSSWGASQSSATPSYGTNAIRINDQTNPTLVIRSVRNGTERGCISAIQIVKAGKELPTAEVEAATETATTASVTYDGNTVTAKLSNLDMGEYETLQARLVISKTTDFGTTKASKLALADGEGGEGFEGEYDAKTQTFTFKVTGLHANSIAHAAIKVFVTDEEGVEQTVATTEISLHQGTVVYDVNGTWINEKSGTFGSTGVWSEGVTTNNTELVVDNAAGVTFTPNMPTEYVEKCDSEFTVQISASEAVDADADTADGMENVQGGLRLVKGSSEQKVKLQYFNGTCWANATNEIAVGTNCTVKTVFHYKGLETEDDDCVTYYVMNGNVTNETLKASTCANVQKKQITEVFVSDGTKLGYLVGTCQTEAVVVDVVVKEIEPGQEIAVDSESAARALTVKVSDAVTAVIGGDSAAVATYKGYFKVVATPTTEGGVTKYRATLEFADEVKTDLEEEVEKALQTVVESFNSEEPKKIKGRPGLYYAIKRGDEINEMEVKEEKIAGPDGTVNIEIKKQEGSGKHFYRVVVSPTPVKPATN